MVFTFRLFATLASATQWGRFHLPLFHL